MGVVLEGVEENIRHGKNLLEEGWGIWNGESWQVDGEKLSMDSQYKLEKI